MTIDITPIVRDLMAHLTDWADGREAAGADPQELKAAVIAVGRIAAMSEGMTLEGDTLQ